MESVRDPNVDPPDRRQVWEAPYHTCSNVRPLTPNKVSPMQACSQGGCMRTGAPPFLLKGGCNDEFAPPPPSPTKKKLFLIIFLNLVIKYSKNWFANLQIAPPLVKSWLRAWLKYNVDWPSPFKDCNVRFTMVLFKGLPSQVYE